MLGKQKVGILGFEFGGWLGGNLSDGGIQVVGSSWAKKLIMLRLKGGGVGLFYKFVRMYYHFVIDVSLYVGWGFVLYLV